ncbi:hypothetical protein KFL_001970145 [Klebsormidium nitens]|uniref:F-box domain-containing protein n=1 Tax=Klebsormidium nitens TaxID=105231 RepID=A0A1Y1I128_KLENI|nr:hypothetical protein KFL_001970145 [Klebsormidium nitens]|eukprot:GAQ84614.1 hypothetical protein KFL_001970145 [Klebsormidium nitens]
MENLPNDVLLIVVRKLAAQDPVSLLRATCSCKHLLRVTEGNRVVWKEAFLGSAPTEQNTEVRDAYVTCAELDVEVDSLGGYKQLALIRAGPYVFAPCDKAENAGRRSSVQINDGRMHVEAYLSLNKDPIHPARFCSRIIEPWPWECDVVVKSNDIAEDVLVGEVTGCLVYQDPDPHDPNDWFYKGA